MERAWVLTPEGRESRLGVELPCRECDPAAFASPPQSLLADQATPEQEARRILRLIDRLQGCESRHDPLRVVQVVNALQPLGKEGALAVIDDYLRFSRSPFASGEGGLLVVVRCLFEVPEPPGHFPPMGLGAPYPDPPEDLRRSPRFPVVLYQDIPFVGILGYSLFGAPERLATHLTPYRERGKIRTRPLAPPDNPLEIIDQLVSLPEWPDWDDQPDAGRWIAREQALRLVDPVYPVERDSFDERLSGDDHDRERQWRAHAAGFAAVNARWDPVLDTYVAGRRGDPRKIPPAVGPTHPPDPIPVDLREHRS
jgi:hypothetical protein